MSKKKGTGKFLLGAAIGAGLGVLFAPKKGSETRRELKLAIDNLLDKAKETSIEDVETFIKDKITEIQEELESLDKEKVYEIAKTKSNEIKKKVDELVDVAIKKGTPVLEKAADAVRKQAIKVTKEVLNKLEEA